MADLFGDSENGRGNDRHFASHGLQDHARVTLVARATYENVAGAQVTQRHIGSRNQTEEFRAAADQLLDSRLIFAWETADDQEQCVAAAFINQARRRLREFELSRSE